MRTTLFLVIFIIISPLAWAEQLQLGCRVQYKKDGELGHRAVALQYDVQSKKLVRVSIDAQPVHSFNLIAKTIFTSVDSERIQIEFESRQITWRSNFRDRDFGIGLCVKEKP